MTSTVSTSAPSCAASGPDCPCGSASTTTSWPARVSRLVSSRTRSASGVRCGCRDPSVSPALLPAVSAPISTWGCPRRRRSTSPPAYPLAPATATLIRSICMTIQKSVCFSPSGPKTPRRGRCRPVASDDVTRLEFPDYLDHIRRDSARFRAVLGDCDPAAQVPSCPDWTAADLLWHLTTVQHWWEAMVTNRPQSGEEMGYEEPARPEAYDALLAAYDDAHAAFLAALEAADPAEPAYSWSSKPSAQTVAFTYRRQAHEALIHRIDAELTTGTLTAMDTALATDGVDETLDKMYGHLPDWGTFDAQSRYVEFRITDAGTSVWTQLGTFSGTPP